MPSWQPSGNQLVFVRYTDQQGDVMLLTQEGVAPQRLTATIASESRPMMSLDGSRIAFSRHVAGELPQVWVMDTLTGSCRQVTTHGGSAPAWSPDGTRIVYVREDPYRNDLDVGVLWIVAVSSGVEVQLTRRWEK